MRSARIVTNDTGGILEIHVVADTARSAKMVARDVESILVAKIGLSIDHRKISVAQVEGEETAEAGPTSRAVAGAVWPRWGTYCAAIAICGG